MVTLKCKFDFYDLDLALQYSNKVEASAQIKKPLACLEGENDYLDWHWLVELKNSKVAYLRGGCCYTGWDVIGGVDLINEYDSIEEALSTLGLPEQCVNSDRLIRKEFREVLEK